MNSEIPTWPERADIAQRSLDHYFGTDRPQFLENYHPAGAGDSTTFNYWWLAHVIDARIDAWERSGDGHWLDLARRTHQNILERNGGSLFNDYFDDMLWLGLALLRLAGATGDERYRRDTVAIWEHVVAEGWNDTFGPSLAWRKPQLDYKNTPANGPLVILSARLADSEYLRYAHAAFDWLTHTLVGDDGFVEDGINRERDGRIDRHWQFTYNQGLYVGAAVELYRRTGDAEYLKRATRTALTAVDRLSDGTVFRGEGSGGDEGLFKGVYYRYLGLLLPLLSADDPDRARLERFVRDSTDALWRTCYHDCHLRAGNDWSAPSAEPIPYSTQLSAIMAIEQRCRLG
ncbi:glycoside hydrolase family 76 protein [Phytoactinopolyspora halotolerans]|uniref:Glycoside hydrolase n=1 Tax=Phytoactinopolyspora halotolerans TaxID=1981512 RepID=A0A6L9SAB4_9ACTN|nr:glycoside hydrolase family 76 protein [Phytoactinopolyspora halotolerans]NEE01993.1 glycoside hydrolase [Phytoactinopolyspora halotolerans]